MTGVQTCALPIWAVKIAAADFDKQCEQGFQVDNNQTFAEYAEYVLNLKEANGTKKGTLRASVKCSGESM